VLWPRAHAGPVPRSPAGGLPAIRIELFASVVRANLRRRARYSEQMSISVMSTPTWCASHALS
jgi:hypothetical protein